jgi:hypothetical protein
VADNSLQRHDDLNGDISDEAGIWREVKAMSKAKTPTKAGMPHFDGPELKTLLQAAATTARRHLH